MSERFALIFSDGSMLILPESVDIQHARKEALSCDENEDNPLNFTMLGRVAVSVIEVVEVPSVTRLQSEHTRWRWR